MYTYTKYLHAVLTFLLQVMNKRLTYEISSLVFIYYLFQGGYICLFVC